MIEALSEQIVHIVHTKDGGKVAMQCVWFSNAKVNLIIFMTHFLQHNSFIRSWRDLIRCVFLSSSRFLKQPSHERFLAPISHWVFEKLDFGNISQHEAHWDNYDEPRLGLDLVRIRNGFVPNLVQCIRGMGNQLHQRSLIVDVKSVDDQGHPLQNVSIELRTSQPSWRTDPPMTSR